MTITPGDEFTEVNDRDFDFAYKNDDIAILGVRFDFDKNKDIAQYSISGFAQNYINSIPDINQDINIRQKDNYIVFERTSASAESEITYFYYTYIYKLNNDFMIIMYSTPVENRAKLDENLDAWVESISFD